MRPLLRVFVTLTTLAVVWLVACERPARAQAPLSRDVRATRLTFEAAMSVLVADASETALSSEGGAGLCDRRGATSLAPPPQMQEREAVLDTSVTFEECLNDLRVVASSRQAGPRRAPVPADLSSASDPAVLPAVAMLAAPPRERTSAPVDTVTHGPIGIRSTIDRPPREA